jgi:hypothetical protein
MSRRHTIGQQPTGVDLSDLVSELPAWARLTLGLILCPTIAYYLTMFAITVTGVWVGNLSNALQAVVAIAILALQGYLGYLIRRPWISCAVFVVLIGGYEASLVARTSTLAQWSSWWQLFFGPLVGFPLSTWMFARYSDSVSLRR